MQLPSHYPSAPDTVAKILLALLLQPNGVGPWQQRRNLPLVAATHVSVPREVHCLQVRLRSQVRGQLIQLPDHCHL